MRPTRRGWTVVLAVVLAVGAGAFSGSRGLNAFAAPGVVALGAAAWQLARLDRPVLERELPRRGEVGATVRARTRLETETPMRARVREASTGGLDASGAEADLVLGEGGLAYDVDLIGRGEQAIGPTTVAVRDVLGLLRRTLTYPERTTLLVRPRVHRLVGARADDLAWLHGGAGDDRQAFDALRQYQRGDPLRDVHWKSSAKRPDDEFVVKQFAVERDSRTVEVVAGATPGEADAMAEAAASVVASLVGAGVRVDLTTPDGRVDDGTREELLDHLARVGAGTPDGRADADVDLFATPTGVRVEVGDRSFPFSALVGSPVVPAAGVAA